MRRLLPVLVLVLAVALAALAGAPAASAASCHPSSGGKIPRAASPGGEVQVYGHGWGHGVGMSQYGAFGAALLGCSASDILTTYYPGVEVARAPELPERLRVSLFPSRPSDPLPDQLRVRAHSGTAPWLMPGRDPVYQPQGRWWRMEVDDSGAFRLVDESDGDRVVWSGGGTGTVVTVPVDGDGRVIQLPSKGTSAQWPDGRPYKHGVLELRSDGPSRMYVTLDIGSRDGVEAMERYLWGLSEMPSSWPGQALAAQAITGRSYALDRWQRFKGRRPGCHCDVYDSTADQVYAGYLKESEGQGASFGRRWVEAVNGSAAQVIRHDGRVATGFYSSSHGGHSTSSGFAFASDLPYLRPVDDSRWETALRESTTVSASSKNRNLSWARGLGRREAGERLGVGTVLSVELPPPHGPGGRIGDPNKTDPASGKPYGGVVVRSTSGTKQFSGEAFVKALKLQDPAGLWSTRFTVETVAGCLPTSDQSSNDTVRRASGPTRIETAVAVSREHWDASEHAVLAVADSFADALSAGALAARLDAPLLLTGGGQLAPAVRAELERLGVGTVEVMGGTAAISKAVEDTLVADGYAVQRRAGSDRFATARAAARAAGASPSGDVVLALGEDWPDAVSAGALAGSPDRIPTLLTGRTVLPQVTVDALGELGAARVLVVGGTAAIAEDVASRVREAGYEVTRLSGRTRFETSVAVARDALGRGGPSPRPAVLASGEAFPDALAAGALTARLSGTLALVPRCDLAPVDSVRELLGGGAFDSGVIVGGTAAVSDLVREQATAAIEGE